MSEDTQPSLLRPVPQVLRLRPYMPPPMTPLIDLPLAGTERPVLTADMRAFEHRVNADILSHYPDKRSLEVLLASQLGVAPEQLLVSAGADEILDRACRAMLCQGRNLVTCVPTFEMTMHYAELCGASLRTLPWLTGAYPVDAVLDAIDGDTGIVAITTPNNPTGLTVGLGDIQKISKAAPHALIVVDMAYGEYAERDITAGVLALPNTLLARTLSKAWGMPGLRLGYAAAKPQVITWLRTAGGPYTVARASLAVAHARLQTGEGDMRVHVERIQYERRALDASLKELGAAVAPSQANFVLAQFARPEWLTDGLRSLGISVREFPHDASLKTMRRITCPGDDAAFERLRIALAAVLAPRAILFDMDGVLADVSRSFRQAVLDTALEFGVTLTLADVAAAKARGGANNDWQVSQRLLADRDVHVTLEQVTTVFERLYQGTEHKPGLRSTETLLCSRALLEDLSKRFPLAVVTGRPHRDAARFLQEHGLGGLFKVVICMEDAPLKPDPAPVRLALTRLGVQSAWMVGDTPDDIRAARGANVVPMGIVAPGDDDERTSLVLQRAGAARVVRGLEELVELLP